MAGISLASTDLLLHVELLPMEQLILHDMATVCSWPNGARGELFAVARRDIAVARRNLARLTHYVDLQDDHLAACDGALDDGIPLMTVEMFSRPTGGVQSILDVANRVFACPVHSYINNLPLPMESMNRKIKLVYSMFLSYSISVITYSIEPGVSFCIYMFC